MNGVFRQPGRWTVGVKFGCHVIPMGERDTKLRPLGEVGIRLYRAWVAGASF